MQTDHARARNTNTHSVLENVAAYLYAEVIVVGKSPISAAFGTFFLNDFHCLSYCQRYSYRLGTAKGRLYFLPYQADDL